jgi:hypothetical protein
MDSKLLDGFVRVLTNQKLSWFYHRINGFGFRWFLTNLEGKARCFWPLDLEMKVLNP